MPTASISEGIVSLVSHVETNLLMRSNKLNRYIMC